MSSMTMTDFNKKLIDLENRITNHSDDFNQKLVDLESKVIRPTIAKLRKWWLKIESQKMISDIKKLQDMTNRIELQLG